MFTVRIPFEVPTHIRIGENRATATAGALEYELKYDGHYHVLVVQGLPSIESVEAFLRCVESGLAWLLLAKGIPVEAQIKPQEIEYYDDPETVGANISHSTGGAMQGPIDAFIQGNECAAYPSNKRIRVATGFPVTLKISLPADQALAVLVEGTTFAASCRVPDDKKLSVALALYGAYFTEHSAKARFLTLIMALEALAEPILKTNAALTLIDRWAEELREFRSNLSLTDDDLISLAALERELIFRREDSIRSQIRKLVLFTLSESPDAEATAKDAVRLYDLRSTLVHDGTLEPLVLQKATSDAKLIVERCLKARFLGVAAG